MSPGFASDNYAGAHPDVLAAVAEANVGQAPAYGNDPWTAKAQDVLRGHLGEHVRVFPVFNGTAANVLCLEAVTEPWEAVICTPGAHVHVDEGGAPERAGRKLLLAAATDGKLSPETAAPLAVRFGDEHAVQPKVLSITQSTELGAVYTVEETRALADWRTGTGCSCTSTGRGSPTPRPRSTCRSARSRPTRGSTSCRSGRRRTAPSV